jgi:hypothetical protein
MFFMMTNKMTTSDRVYKVMIASKFHWIAVAVAASSDQEAENSVADWLKSGGSQELGKDDASAGGVKYTEDCDYALVGGRTEVLERRKSGGAKAGPFAILDSGQNG